MYDSPKAAWLGWTRNFYHSIQSSRRLLAELWLVVACFCLPPVAVVHTVFAASFSSSWWPAAIVWLLSAVFSQLALRRIYEAAQAPPSAAMSHWPGSCFVAAVLARALFDAVLRRTTLWHGVRYAAPEAIPQAN